MNLPTDEGYAEGVDAIMESVTWSLENYPVMRDRILEVLQQFVPDPEDGPRFVPAVGGEWDPGADWTMGERVGNGQ
eukprot:3457990-Pyramimonas_sp.AAC.1